MGAGFLTKRWHYPKEITPPSSLIQAVGGHPLVANTLARRGILDPAKALAFLDPDTYIPSPPQELPGLLAAVNRLERAITNHETILVWGDFDVDGQTATSLLVEALHDLSANVVYHIPVRATEGHGIQPEVLRALLDPSLPQPNPYPPIPSDPSIPALPSPAPSLLLTCDTGIAATQAVTLAHSLGLDVIITDHHEPARDSQGSLHFPAAEAVLNPHFLPPRHPLGTLPGVGVAFKLVEALYQNLGRGEKASRSLDLVALGIVADVAEQRDDTRFLLQRGLRVLRQNRRPGLAALLKVADISPGTLDENHIGFAIGPRLNALGRLGDANPVVEFFTTQDPQRADYLAHRLDSLNLERRLHTDRITRSALDLLRLNSGLQDYHALVLAQPGWHTGIIGIVASRLVERFGLPTVLLNIGEDGIARGSARSMPGLHLTEAIAAQADLLLGFGGHAGAAGLSMEEAMIPEFRSRLSRTVKAMTTHLDLQPTVKIDGILPLSAVDLDFVDDLTRLGPFGAGNPQPILLSQGLTLVSETRIGRESEHLRLVVADQDGTARDILWWRGADEPRPAKDSRFDLTYHARASTFRGLRRLQLEWVDFQLREDSPVEIQDILPRFELVDYRQHPDPLRLLASIRDREEIQVWAEGSGKKLIDGTSRDRLQPGPNLAIWTTPASFHILADVLQQVDPNTVYVFAVLPSLDALSPFLKRLAGLAKTVINRQGGQVAILTLAAAMAHQPDTVLIGLRRLQAMGLIRIQEVNSSQAWGQEMVKISHNSKCNGEDLDEVDRILKAMLAETAAYRDHFRTANLENLFKIQI